jgi:hypothetical protein
MMPYRAAQIRHLGPTASSRTLGRAPVRSGVVEFELFDQVSDALYHLIPDELGEPRRRPRRYGIKVWFATKEPGREHYEAQVVGARHVEGATALALEVGFHSEHPRVEDNDAVMARLLRGERSWRRRLGSDAVAGPFIGRPDDWRRVSETWVDPDLGDPDLAIEVATRLTDYITVLEPLRRR